MLLQLANLPLQAIALEFPSLLACTNHECQRGQTLCRLFANITQSLIATADECCIAKVNTIIVTLYPSLLSRIHIWINLMNSNSTADKSLFQNCSSITRSTAKAW